MAKNVMKKTYLKYWTSGVPASIGRKEACKVNKNKLEKSCERVEVDCPDKKPQTTTRIKIGKPETALQFKKMMQWALLLSRAADKRCSCLFELEN